MTYSISLVRNALIEYFKEKADYRKSLAENQEPWDGPKNSTYAASLELVANYVEALPDDDTTLQRLASCDYLFFPDGDVFQSPCYGDGRVSATDNEAIHCGPRGEVMPPAECAEWFESWAQIAIDEINEAAPGEIVGLDMDPEGI
jgi:hypothetical protein